MSMIKSIFIVLFFVLVSSSSFANPILGSGSKQASLTQFQHRFQNKMRPQPVQKTQPFSKQPFHFQGKHVRNFNLDLGNLRQSTVAGSGLPIYLWLFAGLPVTAVVDLIMLIGNSVAAAFDGSRMRWGVAGVVLSSMTFITNLSFTLLFTLGDSQGIKNSFFFLPSLAVSFVSIGLSVFNIYKAKTRGSIFLSSLRVSPYLSPTTRENFDAGLLLSGKF